MLTILGTRASRWTLVIGTAAFLALLAAIVWASIAPTSSTAGPPKTADQVVTALSAEYPRLQRLGSEADFARDRKTTVSDFAKEIPELLPLRSRLIDRNADRTLTMIPRTDSQMCIAAYFAAGDGLINCNEKAPTIVTYGKAIGIVPQSVTALRFTLEDGTVRQVDVTGDVYEGPPDATRVDFVTAESTIEGFELLPESWAPQGFSAPTL